MLTKEYASAKDTVGLKIIEYVILRVERAKLISKFFVNFNFRIEIEVWKIRLEHYLLFMLSVYLCLQAFVCH